MLEVGIPFPADTAVLLSHDLPLLPQSGQARIGPKRNPQKYSVQWTMISLMYPSPLSESIPVVHDRAFITRYIRCQYN